MSWWAFVVAFWCVCAGYALGVRLTRRSLASLPVPKVAAGTKINENARAAYESDVEQASLFLKTIWTLAASVDDDVDRHSNRVAEISDGLQEPQRLDPQTVMRAANSLIEANQRLQHDLNETKSELKEQRQRIDTYMVDARTDALTGLANRRAFDEELSRRFTDWEQRGSPLSLVMADIDYFKRFNDYHGHRTGDEVLQKVSRVLARAARRRHIVTRYGGEEFAIIMPRARLAEGRRTAERMREAVAAQVFEFDGKDLQVSISAGVAEVEEDEDACDLLERADKALYAAKRAGRNCTYLHDGERCRPATEFSSWRPFSEAEEEYEEDDEFSPADEAGPDDESEKEQEERTEPVAVG